MPAYNLSSAFVVSLDSFIHKTITTRQYYNLCQQQGVFSGGLCEPLAPDFFNRTFVRLWAQFKLASFRTQRVMRGEAKSKYVVVYTRQLVIA